MNPELINLLEAIEILKTLRNKSTSIHFVYYKLDHAGDYLQKQVTQYFAA